MKVITLTVLRCPDAVTPEERTLRGGELTIGRGPKSHWKLDDPEQVLSKEHCIVEFVEGAWQVRDRSTNGTFLNFAETPIGFDEAKLVSHGDRLVLGPYEIEVGFVEEEPTVRGGESIAPNPSTPWGAPEPIGADAAPPWGGGASRNADPPPWPPVQRSSVQPLVPPTVQPLSGPSIFESPPITSPFVAPPPSESPFVAAPPNKSTFAPSVPIESPFAARPADEPPLFVRQVSAPPAGARRNDGPEPSLPSNASVEAFAAFLGGAKVPAGQVAGPGTDPAKVMSRAGVLLRAAVVGIRALLIARGDVQREFRIERTMLGAAINNPLKFSATDEHALAALFDPNIPAQRMMREAVDDLVLHQVASLAATQAAARALLEQMEPAAIEAEVPGGGMLPGAREKRLWEAHKKRYARLVAQFDDDFDSAFGKAFARAYEQAAERRND